MMKRLLIAYCIIVLSSLLLLRPFSLLAAEKARFATSFRFNPHYVMPVLAAVHEDYWKAQGVEVKWLPFVSSTSMQQGVVAGELDMGSLGLNTLIQGVASGIREVMVADPDISSDFYFWVRTDSPLRKPSDLKGTKIGISARFGSDGNFYAV